jgi:hypothetical protein
MQLTGVVPRGIYVWEQVIFQCHLCDIALTQAGDGGRVARWRAGYRVGGSGPVKVVWN